MRKRWRFLLLLLLLITGDYIKRKDFIVEENYVKYKDYNSLNVLAPQGYEVHGIDISRHNGEVWWEKISEASVDSQQISFVFVKSTEGMFFHDREFLDNWNSAKKHKVIRGAYHYFRPMYSSTFQAWNFMINVHLKKGDLPPVLDIEVEEGYSDMILVQKVRNWVQKIEKHYGVKPILYTNLGFYKRIIHRNFDGYPIWIAKYSAKAPALPDSTEWDFWQYSDKATLNGINEKVDLNVFKGSITDLKKLCLQ
jgi:lysozyme